jgi:DNA-damage-inducible protein J
LSLQIRIDSAIKTKAQKTLKDMGMDISSGVKLFLTQLVAEGALPFRPAKDPKKIRAEWDREIAWALKYGKRYTSTKEMFDDLEK